MSDPPYLQALKGEMPIMKMGWFQNYKATFIDTGRFRPVVHIIVGIMTIGYTLEFFTHLRRAPQPPPPPPSARSSELLALLTIRPHMHADSRHSAQRKHAFSDHH